ncbi:MAG: acyltransferase [Ktedonobacteraceae bacterium]
MQPATDSKKNTIAVLDGVRAVACLSVTAYHIDRFAFLTHVLNPGLGPLVISFALAGSSGVTLFFVLSGFLLFLSYARALLFDVDWPSARRFYIRRAFRILPGYYVSLLLLILLTNPLYIQPAHWKELVLFLTLFMDASPLTYQAINGPFWTLAVEWQFYLLLPLLALSLRPIVQHGPLERRLRVLLLCLIALIAWGIATRYWGRSWELHPRQAALLPPFLHKLALFCFYGSSGKFLEDFAAGMMLCVFYTLARSLREHRVVAFLQRYSWWLWGFGIVELFYTAIWSTLPGSMLLAPLIGPHNWLSEIVLAAGYTLCIAALLFGPAQLRGLLEWRPLRETGLLSYAIYIWHLPLLLLFLAFLVPYMANWWPIFTYSAYWVWVALIILPFSYAFYRSVELPWIQLGSRVTRAKEQ